MNSIYRFPYKIGFAISAIALCVMATVNCALTTSAKNEKSAYKTSWFGNNGGTTKETAVQSWIEKIQVLPDGSVWAQAGWDEAHSGRERSIYKDGKLVGKFDEKINIDPYTIKINGKKWKINNPKFLGGDSLSREDGSCKITDAGKPSSLASTNDGKLMVTDNGPRQQVLIYNVSSCPPKLVKTIGEEGGVFSQGKPAGVVEPLRFYGLNGVGMDKKGNVCVGGQMVGGGGWIRCLSPQGKMLWQLHSAGWLSNAGPDTSTDGKFFYNSFAAFKMDYTQTEPGKEDGGFPYKFTINIFKYPRDGRATVFAFINNKTVWKQPLEADAYNGQHYDHGTNGVQYVRTCAGSKYLFGTGQNGPGISIYKSDKDGIFSPMSMEGIDQSGDNWGVHTDDACNLWLAKEDPKKGLFFYRFTGTDQTGNMQFAPVQKFTDYFQNLNMVGRVYYDNKKDALYVTGFTNDKPKQFGWGQVGSKMFRWDGWLKGQKKLHPGYPIEFPHQGFGTGNGAGAADGGKTDVDIDKSVTYKSIAWAGKYAFATFVSTNTPGGGKKGVTDVYDLDTGKKVISLIPDEKLIKQSDIGWVDIVNGTSAFLRSNGEYVVSVEEDLYNKFIFFRWCPHGNCK
jgi:hypothetical protein